MSLNRINNSGSDFTATKYNANMTMLENTIALAIGSGILSGLNLSISSGLHLAISNGYMIGVVATQLQSIPVFTCPTNATSYIWISELGVVTSSTSYTPPSVNQVCLGQVTTSGTNITNISLTGRMDILLTLQQVAQAGGYLSVSAVSTTLTLTNTQYDSRVIEVTGVLGSNVNVIVPNIAGFQWTFINSTNSTITPKTPNGTGIVIAQGKTAIVFGDGTNIRRVTADN